MPLKIAPVKHCILYFCLEIGIHYSRKKLYSAGPGCKKVWCQAHSVSSLVFNHEFTKSVIGGANHKLQHNCHFFFFDEQNDFFAVIHLVLRLLVKNHPAERHLAESPNNVWSSHLVYLSSGQQSFH
jgi:hypothetical protein